VRALSAPRRRLQPQVLIALASIVALEAVFAAMARLGDLSIHIPEFMALALGGGILYCVALYALEHTPEHRAVLWLVLAAWMVRELWRTTRGGGQTRGLSSDMTRAGDASPAEAVPQ